MRIAAALLVLLALTGCQPTDPHGLTRDARACYRQGYGGMVVQIQATKDRDGDFYRWVLTSSCMGERSYSPETPRRPAPLPPAAPQPKVYET